MKNLIIIHDKINISPLYNLFKELNNTGIKISLYSNDTKLCSLFEEINCGINKLKFCQNPDSNIKALFYIVLLPFNFAFHLTWFYLITRKQNKSTIIYMGQGGQILLPLCASILKLKLIVYRNPDSETYPGLVFKLIKLFSTKGNYWVLSNEEKNKLKLSVSKKARIKVLPLGINQNAENQDNIFSQMANTKREKLDKKFFSIGTVITNNHNYLENLFNACKNCLSVIKELQLIIICDANTKNKMQWLTKKLEIDSLVWFVGKETLRRKWCDNLDVYVSMDKNFSMQDFYHLLSAQTNHVPIVAPNNEINTEIIENNKSGLLINMKDSEELSQAIIKLYRDRLLRKKLVVRASEIINERYGLDRMVEEFIKLYL